MSFYECACNNESEKVILEKATSVFTENDLFTLMRIIDRRYTMEDVEFALGEEDADENKLRERLRISLMRLRAIVIFTMKPEMI